jgi:hypothetical protein
MHPRLAFLTTSTLKEFVVYYTEQTGALQEWGIFDPKGTLLAYVKTPMEANILINHLNKD